MASNDAGTAAVKRSLGKPVDFASPLNTFSFLNYLQDILFIVNIGNRRK